MRPSFWIIAVVVALALGTTGCAKKRKDMGAENLDNITEADTAAVDNGGTAENVALPEVDNAVPFDDSPKAPAPEVKASGDSETYTVQKGDTLMKIAFNIYGDIAQWKNLYSWNKDALKKASQLEKGMKLHYQKPDNEPSIEKNGDPYLIKKGDTLATIADEIYAKRSKWKKIWANNKTMIKNPHRIYAGFYIYYQITEAEKQAADKIRAKRGTAPAQMGSADPGSAPAAAAAAAPASAPVAQPDPAATGAAHKASAGGGLSALTRAPASAPATPAASAPAAATK